MTKPRNAADIHQALAYLKQVVPPAAFEAMRTVAEYTKAKLAEDAVPPIPHDDHQLKMAVTQRMPCGCYVYAEAYGKLPHKRPLPEHVERWITDTARYMPYTMGHWIARHKCEDHDDSLPVDLTLTDDTHPRTEVPRG